MPEFPANVEDGADPNHHVREKEIGDVPVAVEEDGVASNECHDRASDERVVCAEWLPEAPMGEGASVNALCFHSLRTIRYGSHR